MDSSPERAIFSRLWYFSIMKKAQIKRGLDAIAAVDKHMAKAIAVYGYPEPRIQPSGFEAFLSTIISQQLSTKAANTILGRVKALLPKVDARSVLAIPGDDLRTAGLSQRKVEYVRGLAQAIVAGDFAPEALTAMDDDSAIAAITQLRGLGQWSAEIYLMFSLGRLDLFPAADLILQTSLQKIKRLKARPTAKIARQKVAHWSPWRSVGSLFLWHYHHNTAVSNK